MLETNNNVKIDHVCAVITTYNSGGLIVVSRKGGEYGRLGMPGGKVEEGETPYEAVVRECEEECGLLLYNWLLVDCFTDNNNYEVFFFTTQAGNIHKAYTKTDEVIEVFEIESLFSDNFGMDIIVYPANVLILDYYKKWS